MRLPILKLYRGGELNQDVVSILRINVSVPDEVLGDVEAQVTANALMNVRLDRMMKEFGIDELQPVFSEIMTRTEKAVRERTAMVPDGVYTHEVTSDGFDKPITLKVTMTIKGSEIDIDYTGTTPQQNRAINVVLNYTTSYSMYAIKCALTPDIPNNDGGTRAIRVSAPEGSILNPRSPAAVGARHLVGHFTVYAVMGALAKVVPHLVVAESGTSGYPYFGGFTSTGRKFTQFLPMGGGYGARPDKDGVNSLYFPSNAYNVPIEFVEAVVPLRFLSKEYITDSGGAGKYRGGCGQKVTVMLTDRAGGGEATVSMITDRTKFPPLGYQGGRAGSRRVNLLNDQTELHSKKQLVIKSGEWITSLVAGGGGFGDPMERDPLKVVADVKAGLVSVMQAESSYGVIVDVEEWTYQLTSRRQLESNHTVGG